MAEPPANGLKYLLLDDTGQIWAYPSLQGLLNNVESYDVKTEIYRAWGSDGQRIELIVTDRDRELVDAKITTVDEHGQMRAALEEWVRLANVLDGRPDEDTASLTTEALVHEAYRLQQRPPSLLRRLRDRWRQRRA